MARKVNLRAAEAGKRTHYFEARVTPAERKWLIEEQARKQISSGGYVSRMDVICELIGEAMKKSKAKGA